MEHLPVIGWIVIGWSGISLLVAFACSRMLAKLNRGMHLPTMELDSAARRRPDRAA